MLNYIKKILNENKFGLSFAGIVFLILMPIYFNARIKLSEIEKNGRVGIAKFVEYKRYPKTRKYYFEYFNGKKKIKTFKVNAPDGFSKKVGLFFEIKYLEKYEDLIIVNFEKEITDVSLITYEGFSLEDIDNY